VKRFIAALVLLFALPAAYAGTVKLEWQAPTVCSDGSALSNCPISGYEVFQGVSPTGTAYNLRETVAGDLLTVTYNDIAPGSRCFYLKTVSGLLKSGESNRFCVTVPAPPPNAPAGFSVTVVVTITTP
jgi:hypothetical protein